MKKNGRKYHLPDLQKLKHSLFSVPQDRILPLVNVFFFCNPKHGLFFIYPKPSSP